MNVLNKKLIRDLWQAKGQFISVLVIVVIGVMFYSGINSGYRNLSGASEKYYKDYRFGDLWASFYKAPESSEQKVRAFPFVKMATGMITLFGIFIGLPFGSWLGKILMASSETDAYTIPFVLGIGSYILAALLTLGFTALANLTLIKKIRSINMVEVLKSNE